MIKPNKNRTRTLSLFFISLFLPVSTSMLGVDLVSVAYASNSQNVSVNANVIANCNLNNGNDIEVMFQSYDPTQISTSTEEAGSFQLQCTKNATSSMTMNQGTQPDGNTRRMAYNGEYIDYEVYSDASYTTIWGSTTQDGVEYISASSAPENMNIYIKIAPNQDVPAGTYTDTLTMTTSF